MPPKTKTVRTKLRKKSWYPVVAPKLFRNALLGDVYTYDIELVKDRRMTVNLMSITNDMKQQSIHMNFRVNRIEDKKAMTEVTGYHMAPSAVKRLVRRNQNKIDISVVCETSDSKRIRVKPMVLTRYATTGLVLTKLRSNVIKNLVETVKTLSFDALMNAVLTYKLQRDLKGKANKIYPLKSVEIKAIIIEEEKKEAPKKKEQLKAVQKPETQEKEQETAKPTETQKPKEKKVEDDKVKGESEKVKGERPAAEKGAKEKGAKETPEEEKKVEAKEDKSVDENAGKVEEGKSKD